jgi:nicotinamidase/pyrazinamidase
MTMGRRDFLKNTVAGAVVVATGAQAAQALAQAPKIKPGPRDVLLVVDVQNDFIPGGALPVKEGDLIVPLVNQLAAGFEHVILTQDWHTPGHVSFASAHQGKKPFETITLAYGTQVLWPDHCVQGTPGADFHKDLKIPHAELVIRKGYRKQMDSYSAFFEADGKTTTGLSGYVKDRGFRQVYLVGLATDFCVCWSALDARKVGLGASVIEDACRGIDTNGSLGKAWEQMAKAGVKRIRSADLSA